MIKFFRKIRQRLITENKVSKYLLYAIGEITLVMIGILLALQINNWNSERIDSKKETRYLHSLIRDLETQILQIDYKVERELQVKKSMEELLEEFRQIQTIQFTDDNIIKFNTLVDRVTYVVNKPTFMELLSTGNIEVIRDDDLRNQIVDYYQKMELSELIILKNNDLKDNTIQPSVLKFVEFSPKDIISPSNPNPNYQNDTDSLEQSTFEFPTMRETAHEVIKDKANLFELVNLLKMRWLISEASINFLGEDRQKALDLMEDIQNHF